jgi:hypothetical protein
MLLHGEQEVQYWESNTAAAFPNVVIASFTHIDTVVAM